MSLISENIKFLRKSHRYTQEQFAEKLGIKRSLLGAYEEDRAEPRLTTLALIAGIFKISLDTLITKDLHQSPLNENKEPVLAEEKLKVLALSIDNQGKENIELVPQKAAAGYLNGYADPEFIERLTRFQLPFLSENFTYRAFEISGDSMIPIEPGTIVIGQYVEKIENIKNSKTYILVTKKDGIVYKRVFNYIAENGKLFLVSDNKNYTPFDIPAEDVIEAWEAKAFISLKFPDPEAEKEMSMDKLTGIVMELQQEVIRLKDQGK